MDVGNLRGFGKPRIDHDQQLIRIFRDALELPRRLGNLMALHAVPAQDEQDIRVIHVGLIVQVLAPVRAPADPEGTGEFLCQSAVLILRTQSSHEPYAEGRLEVAALSAGAHVRKRARTILADDCF